MIRFIIVFSLMSLGVGLRAWSQETGEDPQYDEAHEAEITQKVKKRLYPGGRDEEDLKVQSQITNPVRKLAPQAEIKEDAAEE